MKFCNISLGFKDAYSLIPLLLNSEFPALKQVFQVNSLPHSCFFDLRRYLPPIQ